MASARSVNCSLVRMLETWFATVLVARPSWRDGGVVAAVGHEPEHGPLAIGQLRKSRRWAASAGEAGEDALRCSRPERDVAGGDGSQALPHIVLLRPLEEVTTGTGPERGEERVPVLVHREDDDRDARLRGGDGVGRCW